MAEQGAAALVFEGVSCRRGGRILFECLSFALDAGDAALVTGPNGVGKSSLVRIAGGLLAPADGGVTRHGGVALMTEATALDAERPLRAALGFWAMLDGRDAVATDAAIAETGLAAMADAPVRFLSTGQRRRAALARVIAAGAPIWLLDEPASGLDARSVGLLEDLIARHRSSGGIALVATHQPIALPGALAIAL